MFDQTPEGESFLGGNIDEQKSIQYISFSLFSRFPFIEQHIM